NKVLSISKNHNPTDIQEINRIQSAGGKIINNRINGILNTSRSFGNFEFKTNNTGNYDYIFGKIIPLPDIKIIPLSNIKHIIITSDAPYENNLFTPISFTRTLLSTSNKLKFINELKHQINTDITFIIINIK